MVIFRRVLFPGLLFFLINSCPLAANEVGETIGLLEESLFATKSMFQLQQEAVLSNLERALADTPACAAPLVQLRRALDTGNRMEAIRALSGLKTLYAGKQKNLFSGPFRYHDRLNPPTWTDHAVIYEIFVDRFENGDQTNDFDTSGEPWSRYHGGDFQGLIHRIPYVVELGANVIWVTPVMESVDYHGYRIINFESLERNFGGPALFREFIEKCHAAGIRVIVDFVANHSSNTHPFFLHAQQSRESPFFKWYKFQEWPHRYECFFGYHTLPKLNMSTPEARAYIKNIAREWALKYELDGYRLDYATGLGPEFWVEFTQAVREVRPDTYFLGEVWENENDIKHFVGPLDGCFNFPLYYSLLDFVVNKGMSPANFFSRAEHLLNFFGSRSRMGTFIGNHDVRRILTLAGGDLWKVYGATFLQMTLPGVPVIYYGDEIGLEGGDDPDNRRPMNFQGFENKKIFQLTKKLVALRKSYPHLSHAPIEKVFCQDEKRILVFARPGKEKRLLVVYNNDNQTHEVSFRVETSKSELRDLLTDELFPVVNQNVTMKCDGHWARILEY